MESNDRKVYEFTIICPREDALEYFRLVANDVEEDYYSGYIDTEHQWDCNPVE